MKDANGGCKRCNTSINEYYDNGTCSVCDLTGNFLNTTEEVCGACLTGCITCTNASACVSCNSGNKYVDDEKGGCRQCNASENEYFDNGKCSICDPNGNFIENDGCKPCIENCITCNSSSTCQLCN